MAEGMKSTPAMMSAYFGDLLSSAFRAANILLLLLYHHHYYYKCSSIYIYIYTHKDRDYMMSNKRILMKRGVLKWYPTNALAQVGYN